MQISANASIDLQMHTIHSDGKWTPEDLIDHLLREGFSAAAITDHDRVDIVPMLQEIARAKGFMLLPAVEMSTNWRGQWVDLLCFGVPQHESPLHALGAELLHRQRQNTHWRRCRASWRRATRWRMTKCSRSWPRLLCSSRTCWWI